MSPADRDHRWEAMANGIGKSFNASVASTTFIRSVIPFTSGLIRWDQVQPSSVDKSPVAEVYTITREEPRGSIGIFVLEKRSHDLPLVRLRKEFCCEEIID